MNHSPYNYLVLYYRETNRENFYNENKYPTPYNWYTNKQDTLSVHSITFNTYEQTKICAKKPQKTQVVWYKLPISLLDATYLWSGCII